MTTRATGVRVAVLVAALGAGRVAHPRLTLDSVPRTYVGTGTILFTSGTDEFLAPAGSLVTVSIGDPHTFGNADTDTPAHLLCTVTPERYLGYFRDLQDLRPEPGGMLNPSDVLGVMARYATEPYRA